MNTTWPLPQIDPEPDLDSPARPDDGPSLGALVTGRGNLPLEAVDVRARLDGLLAQVVLAQTFVNPTSEPLEATYIFPLPDRAGVTRFRMEVAGRVVEGRLDERGRAREAYEEAVQTGHRAAIAEEERPGVFTIRVGNILPGERAVVRLTTAGVLPYVDGEVTFRFPLVVAPRYVPGVPLPGPSVGDGVAPDTDAAPDASRISPPVLLPGCPLPVRLTLAVDLYGPVVDPAAGGVRSSLHAVRAWEESGRLRVELQPGGGERFDRDFILRYRLAGSDPRPSLSFHPDGENEGVFALTVVPPAGAAALLRPRDVVFVLDRSGSMEGWKMVAARRAVARMVDTLGPADRFAVLAFSTSILEPDGQLSKLVAATDRGRFRAVEFLAGQTAGGGTEMVVPLVHAAGLLAGSGAEGRRDRVLVLVTDGQIANEDEVLRTLSTPLAGARVFTLGIDRAVNEGFLNRLAQLGGPGGGCELVETEERLDAVLLSIHRRIGGPLLTDLTLHPSGWEVVEGTTVPERVADVHPTSPLLLLGRYQGPPGPASLSGRVAGGPWSAELEPSVRENPAAPAAWARLQLRKLEDRYALARNEDVFRSVEREMVDTSLRYHVLCRFTAYVAVDAAEVANPGAVLHRVVQPVAMPQGWAGLERARPRSRTLDSRHAKMGYDPSQARPAAAPPPAACAASSPPMDFGSPPVARRRGRDFEESLPPPAACVPQDGFAAPPATVNSARPSGPSHPLPPGFEFRAVIGDGGDRAFIRAHEPARGRDVLLRFVPTDRPHEWAGSDEVRRVLAFRQPGVVPVLAVIPAERGAWVVYRATEGTPLSSLSQPSPRDAVGFVLEAAEALALAYAAGLVHPDLTSDSVWVGKDGLVRVVGLLDVVRTSGQGPRGLNALYAAPEQRDGACVPPDAQTNVYALGVMFFRLLTGVRPYSGDRRGASLPPEITSSPRAVSDRIPEAVDAVCVKALAPSRADRFASVEELAAALRGLQARLPRRGWGGAWPRRWFGA